MYGLMDARIDGCIVWWMSGLMNVWISGCMD